MGKLKTKEEFIMLANDKFGERFDYSKSIYINMSSKILISCKEHGEFKLTPEQHIRSQQGCPKCPLKKIGRKPKTVKQFVIDATKKHGKKFDYSQVVYKNNKTDVHIICPDHGSFLQSPCEHLKGVYGCRLCAPKGTKLTQEQYLQRAKAVHGERYDYTKTVYTLNKNPINVICREHGEFTLATAGNHLTGAGCSDCPKITDVSTEQWIQRARKTHGNRYDYNCTEYVGANTNLNIRCHTHGIFSQIASHHERGSHCPKCVGRHSYSNEEFITKCIAMHGDKYDYSSTIYNGAKEQITYICPAHGEVSQQAYDHMVGYGCAYCAGRGKYTTNQWVDLSRQIHGDHYDYSKVDYQGKSKKVVIICPEHGEFKQQAGSHIRGNGCQKCSETGFDSSKPGYLYLLHSCTPPLDLIKVGITNNILPRLNYLRLATPFNFKYLNSVLFDKGRNALVIETQLKSFANKSGLSVTFKSKFKGYTEWFKYSDNLINQRNLLVTKRMDIPVENIPTSSKGIEKLIKSISKPTQIKRLVSTNIR